MHLMRYIILFVSVLLSVLTVAILHLIYDDVKQRRFNRNVQKIKSTLGGEVKEAIKRNEVSLVLHLKPKMKETTYARAFHETIEEMHKELSDKTAIPAFMSHFEDDIKARIDRGIPKFGNRMEGLETIHFIHMLGEYQLDRPFINSYLLKAISHSHFYLRWTAISSLIQIGNQEAIVEGLTYMSSKLGEVNHKLIVDLLDRYHGDMDQFNRQLLDSFDRFPISIQRVVVTHFSHHSFDGAKDHFVKLLKNTLDFELLLQLVRYFGEVKVKGIKSHLLLNALHPRFEMRAVTATTLRVYKDEDFTERLLMNTSDSNWYVRYNSAKSLLKHMRTEDLLVYAKKTTDQFSSDIILFTLFEAKKMSYEDYLSWKGEG